MEFFSLRRNNSVLTPVMTIILGLLLVINPFGAGRGVAIIIGIVVLLAGAADLIRYFMTNERYDFQRGDLFSGIVKCLLGLFLLTHVNMVLSLITYIAGIFLILCGAGFISGSMSLRSVRAPGWETNMVLSVLVLVMGIFMLFNPFRVVSAAFLLLGLILLLSGIFGLYQWYQMRKFF